MPHTTAYQEPARLASGGYLSARQEKGGRRRRRYALTDAGREALRAWADDPVAAPPQLRDEMLLKIFAGADPEPLVEARLDWYRARQRNSKTCSPRSNWRRAGRARNGPSAAASPTTA